jgi:hypothetical protein
VQSDDRVIDVDTGRPMPVGDGPALALDRTAPAPSRSSPCVPRTSPTACLAASGAPSRTTRSTPATAAGGTATPYTRIGSSPSLACWSCSVSAPTCQRRKFPTSPRPARRPTGEDQRRPRAGLAAPPAPRLPACAARGRVALRVPRRRQLRTCLPLPPHGHGCPCGVTGAATPTGCRYSWPTSPATTAARPSPTDSPAPPAPTSAGPGRRPGWLRDWTNRRDDTDDDCPLLPAWTYPTDQTEELGRRPNGEGEGAEKSDPAPA